LRNKVLESRIALDAVPHALHSIALVWQHHCPGSCCGSCVNAGPVSRAEFTWTTSSHGCIASWMRSYADLFRQLSPQRCRAADNCADNCCTIFEGSSSQSDLGRVPVSSRMHLRACAARALL